MNKTQHVDDEECHIIYMFFFCLKTALLSDLLCLPDTQKNQKRGLKKGGWWFRMVSSGTKWGAMWGLTIRERIPDVIRRV